MTEAQLQEQVADYLRLQYPGVMFHSDFGSGIKLTPGQAMKQKRQNGGQRAWPDMFIAECKEMAPGVIRDKPYKRFTGGLFLELSVMVQESTRKTATMPASISPSKQKCLRNCESVDTAPSLLSVLIWQRR